MSTEDFEDELPQIKMKERDISELKFTDTNPVMRTKKGRRMINQSLSELGPGRSVLIDENDTLVAGNGTIEQAKELGITRVIEIELPDRHTIIAVKKSDMDEHEKYRMAMFDNAAAKNAVYNPEGLAEIATGKGVSIEGIFTEKEFDKIILPKEEKTQLEPEDLPEGENKFYVVVECEDKGSQDSLFEYLQEEGYQAMKYEGNKRG